MLTGIIRGHRLARNIDGYNEKMALMFFTVISLTNGASCADLHDLRGVF